jgi:hypothetical protein
VPDQVYVWYDCEKCGSALLWVGGGQWVYQNIGRDDKQHLLGQPLTVDDLEALLPPPEADLLEIPFSSEMPEIPSSSDWFEIPASDEVPEAIASTEPVEVPVSDVLESPAHDDLLEVPFGEDVVAAPVEDAVADQPVAEGKKVSALGSVIPWLLILCLLVVLAVATIVVVKMANGTLNLPINP